MQYFIHVKSILRTKSGFSIEKFPFFVLARNMIMLQHLIHFLLHDLSSGHLQEVKSKGKLQTFSSKSGRSRLREMVTYKTFQTY